MVLTICLPVCSFVCRTTKGVTDASSPTSPREIYACVGSLLVASRNVRATATLVVYKVYKQNRCNNADC